MFGTNVIMKVLIFLLYFISLNDLLQKEILLFLKSGQSNKKLVELYLFISFK